MGNSHAQQQWLLEQLPTANLKSELPFLGGLMGYWSYDLGRNHADIPSQHPPVTQLPLARLGLFDWCITFDHVIEQAWLVGSEQRRKQVMEWLNEPATPSHAFRLTQPFIAELSQAEYTERFAAVQRYILAGTATKSIWPSAFRPAIKETSGRHTLNCVKQRLRPFQALWHGVAKLFYHSLLSALSSAVTAWWKPAR